MSDIPFASDCEYEPEWIPTGIASLDKILGGGIPTKRITEISGPPGIGKTTLALMCIASAQKEGYTTLWCDQEWAWDASYASSRGVDTKKCYLMRERFAEASVDKLEAFSEEHHKVLIVIDSIGAMLTRQEAEKDASSKTIGAQAGLVAKMVRKLTPLIGENNIAVIVLNHEYMDIMTGRVCTSGGAKLNYAKSIWLKLRKANKNILKSDKKVGEVVIAEIRKNKLADTMRQECSLELFYGHGFSKKADLLQTALDKGIITKEGNSYFFSGKKLCTGMPKLREWAKNNADKIQI